MFIFLIPKGSLVRRNTPVIAGRKYIISRDAMDNNAPKPRDLQQNSISRETDRIQRFFGRPFFLSITIGFPFCLYKILFGITAIRVGSQAANTPLESFGWIVVIWAGIDLIMNIGRASLDILHRPARFEYCTIAQAGRIFHLPMAFLALDTLVSFVIICLMLWSGWIRYLTPPELYLWYFATTLNLVSISLVSLYHETRIAR
jgi:hypothetical protein